MNTVQLNAEELKGFIKHMVNNNQHIQAQGKVPVAVNIEGDAGLMRGAKTAGEKAVGEFRNNPTDSPYAKGGMTASKRGDGIAQRGKTKGRMV